MICEVLAQIEPREDRVMFSRGFSFLPDQPVAQNRLVQVNILNAQPPNVADNIEMTYDGFGRRVSILEQHGTTVLTAKTFVWCGAELCQQRDPTGHTIVNQFFALGEVISGTNYYYAKDHLDNIREMTDSSGVVHANYDYDPFGRQTKLSGDLDADFGYTGMYVERAASLDLTWFRAYDANKGRWLSRDPLGLKAGLNLYSMVLNNPLRWFDLFGLCGPTAVASADLNPNRGNPSTGGGGAGSGGGGNVPSNKPTNTPAPSPTLTPNVFANSLANIYGQAGWEGAGYLLIIPWDTVGFSPIPKIPISTDDIGINGPVNAMSVTLSGGQSAWYAAVGVGPYSPYTLAAETATACVISTSTP